MAPADQCSCRCVGSKATGNLKKDKVIEILGVKINRNQTCQNIWYFLVNFYRLWSNVFFFLGSYSGEVFFLNE